MIPPGWNARNICGEYFVFGLWTAKALRLLLLLVMTLAGIEYILSSILDASLLRTFLYTPLYSATQPTLELGEKLPKTITTINLDVANSRRSPQTKSVKTPKPSTSTKKELESSTLSITKLMDSIKSAVPTTDTESSNVTNTSSTPPLLPYCTVPTNLDWLPTTEIIIFNSISPESPIITELPSNILWPQNEEFTTLQESASTVPPVDIVHINNYFLSVYKLKEGPISVDKTEIDLSSLDLKFPQVKRGGWYKPPNCTARHRVAIIVPYRDRQQHLAIFLNHMHPFLMKQQIEYGIFIVEQIGNAMFNRAKLFNVGFVESNRQRTDGWQCFIFHDIDLLPMDERNLYTCPRQPRHMSASVDQRNFKLLYEDIFGGVSAMTYEQFTKVNGFSNNYWGWGAEDDDMALRLKEADYHIARYKMSIARYAMLDHEQGSPSPVRYALLSVAHKNFNNGLSTLRYELNDLIKHRLFTLISVYIDDGNFIGPYQKGPR